MSVSTDAIICFGKKIDNEFLEENFGEDEIYDLEHSLSEKFDMSNLELVSHCHCDEPMYIVAIKGTRIEAFRGYPEYFCPDGLKETVTELGLQALKQFEGEPNWILCSYWG